MFRSLSHRLRTSPFKEDSTWSASATVGATASVWAARNSLTDKTVLPYAFPRESNALPGGSAMKRRFMMFRYLFLMTCLALLSILMLNAAAEAQKVMSVQVREGQLRATPSHLGKIVARASYGDRVTVFEERGDWRKVSLSGRKSQGWIHISALTNKQLALRAGQGNVGSSVSGGEIALAGKGFSKEVEAQYRQSNKNLDYAWIDRMEAFNVSPSQVENFIAAGRLAPVAEGGKP